MQGDDYRVKLEAFEGPLDLLLFLIRKDQLDIHDIPISHITDQYLVYLRDIHAHARLDIDEAGEFLVMAATLTEIKSRMLMAPLKKEDASEAAVAENGAAAIEDPRAELVKQLLEYKKYRDAADNLEDRAEEWSKRFGIARTGIDSEAMREVLAASGGASDLDMDDLSLVDLVEAFKKIVDTVNFDKLGEHQVTFDDTPIELHAADIVTRLSERAAGTGSGARGGEMELREFFVSRTRSEMVGLFLALLELVRNGKVAVRQEKSEGKEASIYVRRVEEQG